jgi:sigma-B regulation protein RsbU (phosphoserine phosphatase)
VLGLFEEWDCCVGVSELCPGDTLVVYTDGVVEATNGAGEEFGESRLMAAAREAGEACSAAILRQVTAAVQRFSPGEQGDDITLLIARATDPGPWQ